MTTTTALEITSLRKRYGQKLAVDDTFEINRLQHVREGGGNVVAGAGIEPARRAG